MGEQHLSSYEFGPFRVDPLTRILWRDTEPVSLTSRVFDTLLILIQNAGATLAKEEIIERVWGSTIVEENNLTQCISALRKALGEGRSDHRFIVTVSGRGYRFVAKVEAKEPEAEIRKSEIRNQHSNTAPQASQNPAIQNLKSKIENRKWLSGAALALAAIGFLWLVKGIPRRRGPQAIEAVKPATGRGRTMLAVLPFENLTGDPTQDYFSDGLTEEVITQLGRQDPDHLGVIARTSVMRYKHGDESIGKIARELGVEYILEGSVRRSGDRVRISAQLIKASDQSHVWSQSYERPVRDVLAVQESVAREVKEHIANRLDRQGLAARSALRPVDPAAYRAYLEGLYFLNRRDVADYQKAIEEFEAAIRKDRSYALAYAALADTHILLTLEGYDAAVEGPKARSAALKAVALDPSLAESHTALAAVDVLYRWDWRTAEQEFKLALRANPNYELAHHWFAALVLGPQGRYPEAIAEMKLAQRLDPVSLIVNTDLGWTYFIAGRRRGAFAQYQKTLRLDQRFVPVHYRLFEYYVSEGMYAQAVHEAALDAAYSGNPEAAHKIEQEYRARGFPRFLASQIEAAKQGRSRIGRLGLARNDALLGRNDEAIGTLSTLVDTRDPAMIYLRLDPELASLHSDPRFQQLERRCGLVP